MVTLTDLIDLAAIALIIWIAYLIKRHSDTFSRFVWGFIVDVLPYWIAIYFALKYAMDVVIGQGEYDTFWIQALCFCIYLYLVASGTSSITVDQNTCKNYEHAITGWISTKWPGFNWLGLFAKQMKDPKKFIVDTTKHQNTTGNGDWSAEDDKMKGGYSILWRVGIHDIPNRDRNMVKYVKTTDDNIEADIKLTCGQVMTKFCRERPSDKAKKEMEDAIKKTDFEGPDGVCNGAGIEILKCGLSDLDYSDETEKDRAKMRRMDSFNQLVLKRLNGMGIKKIEDAKPEERAEAERVVKADMLGGNYQEIQVTPGVKVIVTPKKTS